MVQRGPQVGVGVVQSPVPPCLVRAPPARVGPARLLKEVVGVPVRQSRRFTQLVQLGAAVVAEGVEESVSVAAAAQDRLALQSREGGG